MITLNLLRKSCRDCKKEIRMHEFPIQIRTRSGRTCRCWPCTLVLNNFYRQRNSQSSNAQRTEYCRRLRIRVIEKLGGHCVQCGFADPRALQIDHVHNDGCADPRRIKRQVVAFRMAVLRDTDGRYQLLCANCNTIKAYEFRETLKNRAWANARDAVVRTN